MCERIELRPRAMGLQRLRSDQSLYCGDWRAKQPNAHNSHKQLGWQAPLRSKTRSVMTALGVPKRYCYLGLVALLLAAHYWTESNCVLAWITRNAVGTRAHSHKHTDGALLDNFPEAFEQAPSPANGQRDDRASNDAIARASNQAIGQATTRPSSPINEASNP